jgi:hypothetical protein
MCFEEMPIPKSDEEFVLWLVPARNNIQRQLLRLQTILGRPSTNPAELPRMSPRDSMPYLNGLMLGVGFSLWRAVFQAGHALERDLHLERGRIFLNEIIRNNAAVYSTELNSWSLGYYLENARFRLLTLRGFLGNSEKLPEIDKYLVEVKQSWEHRSGPAPQGWVNCFHVMRLMLDIME